MHVDENLGDDERSDPVSKCHDGAAWAFEFGRHHLAGHQPWQRAYANGENGYEEDEESQRHPAELSRRLRVAIQYVKVGAKGKDGQARKHFRKQKQNPPSETLDEDGRRESSDQLDYYNVYCSYITNRQ